jgi:hypothetical protein
MSCPLLKFIGDELVTGLVKSLASVLVIEKL